jgi:hypothetical protein
VGVGLQHGHTWKGMGMCVGTQCEFEGVGVDCNGDGKGNGKGNGEGDGKGEGEGEGEEHGQKLSVKRK